MDVKKRAYKSAIGGILSATLTLGCYASMSVYLFPVSEAFGVSIGEVSLLFTFASISSLIASVLFGSFLKKVGLRPLLLLCSLFLFSLYAAFAFAKSIVLVYAGAFLFGISSCIAGYIIAQTEITWWFNQGRGKLIGLISVAIGAAGMVLPPVITFAIGALGVRTTALIQGGIVAILMAVNTIFLLSGPPSAYGMKPYGYVEPPEGADQAKGTQQQAPKASVGAILRSVPFWMIVFATFLSSAALTGFTNNASAFFQSIGNDAMAASLCLSVFSGCKMIWGPVFGTLSDKKGPAFAVTVCGLVGAAVLFAGPMLSGFAGAIVIAALLGAINFSGMLGALCFPRMFGTGEAANLMGFGQAAGAIGPMIAPALAGFIFDTTGSYSTFLTVAAVMVVVCVIFTAAAMGSRQKKTA